MDKFIVKKRKPTDENEFETAIQNRSPQELVDEIGEEAEPSTSKNIFNIESTSKKFKKNINRKYQENYLTIGFSWTGDESNPLPLCVVCSETLSNESMVPSKLKRHFMSKHANLSQKPIGYFKNLENSINRQKKVCYNFLKVGDKAQEASYAVAELLAQKMKSHLTAESVILPACRKMVKIMLGENAEKEILKIPLSNNTISRRINDMSEDIEEQVIQEFESHETQFALQVDESTDISGKAQVLAFVRYVHKDDIITQFLCCKELTETTTGNDIFTVINEYLTKCKISWKSCVGVCTDGAPSMVGSIKGFCARAKKENPNIITTHCFLHREALLAKTISPDLQQVLNQVVKIVNQIKSKSQQIRIFRKLCEAMQSQHKNLIFHTEVRWLSRGRVLARVYELREELLMHFTLEELEYANYFSDDSWIAKVAFLSDLFDHLNKLNLSMQGKEENILVSQDKVVAFKEKLNLWLSHTEKNNFEMFPLLNGNKQYPEQVRHVSETLKKLSDKMEQYFPSIDIKSFDWVRDPFVTTSTPNELNLKEQEELIEIRNNRSLQIRFNKCELARFWIGMKEGYPNISQKAIEVLLPFSTSYLCELGFSAMTEIKHKKRERLLSLEQELRVCLSTVRPRIAEICTKRQSQISH